MSFYSNGTVDAYKLCEKGYRPSNEEVCKLSKDIYVHGDIIQYPRTTLRCPPAGITTSYLWEDSPLEIKLTYWTGFFEQLGLHLDLTDVKYVLPKEVHTVNEEVTFSSVIHPDVTPEEGKKIMATTTLKNRTIKAATHGAKVAAADKAADNLVTVFEKALGKSYPEGLKNSTGRELVKFFLSAGVLEINTRNPGLLPVNEGVNVACELVVDASTRNVVGPLLKKLTPALKKLAQAGAAVEAASDES